MASKRGATSRTKKARIEKGKQRTRRYEEDLFLNYEYGEKFRSNFSRRKVVGGRIVDLDQFSDFQIRFLFERMDWLSMITLNKSTYPTLVKYFL